MEAACVAAGRFDFAVCRVAPGWLPAGGPAVSGGKASARDAVYGRRGGGWVAEGKVETRFDRPCSICGQPMVVGQHGYHVECCADAGGMTSHPPCNPKAFTDGPLKIDGCARCYLGTRP